MAVNKVVFGKNVIIDISDADALVSNVQVGKSFYLADGTKASGTLVGETLPVSEGTEIDDDTLIVKDESTGLYQAKTVTPTTSSQTVAPDSGYDALSSVTVNPIPANYIIPSGSTTIESNGTVDVAQYASAVVNVDITPNLQSKTATPTESSQTITADDNYDGLAAVTVAAVSNTYVGTGIAKDPSLQVNGNRVTAPSGYYSSSVYADIAEVSRGIPSISVSDAGLITASVSQPEGYVSNGTTSSTQQITTMTGQTITPTTISQTVQTSGKYMVGDVTINAIPANYINTSDATASASDVLSGETAYVNGSKITGVLEVHIYHTGNTDPVSSLGSDGDLYLKVANV